ncbi:SDR family oxidoreductase [Altererythrobacter arenosus]|uniref:SDR family oxidoreductase n=1 Tax=Altererythrobacter arenosus TaxID=3032592 RepID=A0ABY8FWQ7_9SPHN|nr:SDR family oxidoreductase [Altererythrobacter sp. CAU 1644]WFL77661.1 SDR family oxidoreductase [Altererythrobacter sp. CAU 1644]
MDNLFGLEGKVAVVTGAGRGIGEGIATLLAEAGADVVCAARSTDQIERTAKAINGANSGGRAIFQQTDVSSDTDMEALAQRAIDEFGRLDIWVNNAGGSLVSAPLTQLPVEEWEKTLAVNLGSVFYSVRAAVKRMTSGGAIVNISSLAGQDPFPGSGHYSAAKAGVIMLTKTLALELGEQGIRVNAILPGFVPTDTVKQALSMKDEDFGPLLEQLNLPAGRLGTPQDIAACVLYLVSPASEWMTGQSIRLAGTV